MKRKSSGRTRTFMLVALASLAAVTTAAKDRQFDGIVHQIEAHYHRKPVRFMGLVAFAANRAHPEGVRNIRLAVFENLDESAGPLDSGFAGFMERLLAPEFHPFVRVQSRRDGEQTHIFARSVGDDFELLIVTVERDGATVMKMRLNPEAMSDWVDDPADKAKHSVHSVDDLR